LFLDKFYIFAIEVRKAMPTGQNGSFAEKTQQSSFLEADFSGKKVKRSIVKEPLLFNCVHLSAFYYFYKILVR